MRHALLSMALVCGIAGSTAAAAPPPRPNVILVFADDLGLREIGVEGQGRIPTPNIDRLAAEGMRLTQFRSASPVCAPSRCALLTGRHTGRAAIRGNREVGGWEPDSHEGQWPLPAAETTLAERLRQRGYATAAIGKWGLGGPGTEGHPLNQGFDRFFGYLCQRRAHNLYPDHLWDGHQVVPLCGNACGRGHARLPAGTAAVDDDAWRGTHYAPQRMLEEAERFVTEAAPGPRPFFLYFATPLPHLALQAPAEAVERFPREWDERPYLGDAGYLPNSRPRATYAAMVAHVDEAVGRLRTAVERAGVAENTVILFTSDNGTSWVGGIDLEFFGSLAGLRGRKATLWDGGLRVPMIAHWPGRIGAGTSDLMAVGYDLPATILELVDGREPGVEEALDGLSFAPTLLGAGEQRRHETIYFEFPEGGQSQAAILEGRWKAIRTGLAREMTPTALFDLAADPGEERDLAPVHPDIVARAEAAMLAARTPSVEFPMPTLDRLHAGRPIDLARRTEEIALVDLESGQYLGHVSTITLADGGVLAAYPRGHGRGAIVLRRSDDGGRTWSPRLPVPENWATSQETPTLFRVRDPRGGPDRIVLFSGLHPVRTALSEDEGRTWSPLRPVGAWGGIVAMGDLLQRADGTAVAFFHDDGRFLRPGGRATGEFTLLRTESVDGGRTWSDPEAIFASREVHLCEPGLVRSPDGTEIAMLLRENRRVRHSHAMFSRDEGRTWSAPRELSWALTGDRHVARYAPDGRLVVVMRDMAPTSPFRGDVVAWIGRYEDLASGGAGEKRLRLLDNRHAWDCGYAGLELLPDGRFLCTTYGHWEEHQAPYVVAVRFGTEAE